jgi:hypothetical protein
MDFVQPALAGMAERYLEQINFINMNDADRGRSGLDVAN